jgi:hypothetical protein
MRNLPDILGNIDMMAFQRRKVVIFQYIPSNQVRPLDKGELIQLSVVAKSFPIDPTMIGLRPKLQASIAHPIC